MMIEFGMLNYLFNLDAYKIKFLMRIAMNN